VARNQVDRANLPVRGNLTLVYVVSSLIAILIVITSTRGLLCPGTVYPTRDLRRSLLPNDVVNLLVGTPALLASMWLARRGVLSGLLLWPGLLLFVLYDYLVALFCMPLDVAFLLDLSLVTLSVYTTIGLIASIDRRAVEQQLWGAVPAKSCGAILAGAGVLIFARVIGILANAVIRRTSVAATDAALDVTDFLMSPALIIGGVLLWRRKALGYVTGLGLLFLASMLFVGLIVFMMARPFTTGEPFVFGDVMVIGATGLLFFIPFGLFLRAVAGKCRPSSTRR
jgi:hypothetical protein